MMPHPNTAGRFELAEAQPSLAEIQVRSKSWRGTNPTAPDDTYPMQYRSPWSPDRSLISDARKDIAPVPTTAREIMAAKFISVQPDTSVGDVANVLVRNGLSEVPVMDNERRIAGMVSEGDLLRRPEIATERKLRWWSRYVGGDAGFAARVLKERGARAEHVMSFPAITVDQSAPLSTVADTFERDDVRRLPVVENGKVVGMVSRGDLLRALGKALDADAALRPSDEELRHEVGNRLAAVGADHWLVKVSVHEGVVTLAGFVSSGPMRRAVRVTAESTPGVFAVKDRMIGRPFAGDFATITHLATRGVARGCKREPLSSRSEFTS